MLVQGLLPFAVVGSMEEVKVGKRMVRGRHYPWGVLQGKYEIVFQDDEINMDCVINALEIAF
jgi:septin family protein